MARRACKPTAVMISEREIKGWLFLGMSGILYWQSCSEFDRSAM